MCTLWKTKMNITTVTRFVQFKQAENTCLQVPVCISHHGLKIRPHLSLMTSMFIWLCKVLILSTSWKQAFLLAWQMWHNWTSFYCLQIFHLHMLQPSLLSSRLFTLLFSSPVPPSLKCLSLAPFYSSSQLPFPSLPSPLLLVLTALYELIRV